jgi:hypothetical protein
VKKLKAYFYQSPLKNILILALVVRIFAALFSGGYAMHDDHFLVIETASSWADDEDYNGWMPWTQEAECAAKTDPLEKQKCIENIGPEGHSLTYPGINYIFFETFNALGIDDPLFQMFLIRLIHALFSLWLVYLGYKITEKVSTQKNAIIVGLTLAVGFVMPFLAVRNLVEVVCIPFYLYGIWKIIQNDIKDSWKPYLLAGFFFGIAFAIRFQLFVFFGVMGLVFMFQFKWRACISLLLGFSISLILTQGIVDYFLWKSPFAEFMAYVGYNSNLDTAKDYATSTHWYTYPGILAGMTIPILGLFYWIGAFRMSKKMAWLFFPMLAFLIFHAVYPNHQERFIFPMLPVFLIIGVIGWSLLLEEIKFLKKKPKTWKSILIIGWSLNFLLLPFFTTFYGKQSRVMAAYALYPKKNEQIYYIQEDVAHGKATFLPRHYAGNWNVRTLMDINSEAQLAVWSKREVKAADYIFLYGTNNLKKRINFFNTYFPDVQTYETIDPSIMDAVLHWLNPRNKNQTITVLKTNVER